MIPHGADDVTRHINLFRNCHDLVTTVVPDHDRQEETTTKKSGRDFDYEEEGPVNGPVGHRSGIRSSPIATTDTTLLTRADDKEVAEDLNSAQGKDMAASASHRLAIRPTLCWYTATYMSYILR